MPNRFAVSPKCKSQLGETTNMPKVTDSLFLQNAKASCGSELDRTGHACDFTCAVMQEVMQVMKVDLMRPW